MPNEVVRAALRLSANYKANARPAPMVKRIRSTKVTAGTGTIPVGLSQGNPDAVKYSKNKKGEDVKSGQEWKYAGGNVERLPSTTVNGVELFDHITKGAPRRKQESSFFITVNTNKAGKTPEETQDIIAGLEAAVTGMGDEAILATLIKFGPMNPEEYGNDKYADVVKEVSFQGRVEIGPVMRRVHAHIILKVIHYSQIHMFVGMMQEYVKTVYNKEITLKGGKFGVEIKGKPWVAIRRLPQQRWREIMEDYLRKGMRMSDSARDKLASLEASAAKFSN